MGNTESVTAVNGLQGAVTLGLEALDNVNIASVGAGEILKYGGAGWLNRTLQEAGIATLNDTTLTGSTVINNLTLTNTKVKIGLDAVKTNQSNQTVALGYGAGQSK